MTISFLNPAGFWAFLGLALPLIIHLLHRGRRKHVLVGSVRFLKGRQTHTLSRLRLTERRLLTVRLLLFASLALILSRPHLIQKRDTPSSPGWLLVDPRLDLKNLPDPQAWLVAKAEDQQWRISWLQPGFPEWTAQKTDRVSNPQISSLWSLAAEAAWEFPDDAELHFLVTGHSNDFQGSKPWLVQKNWSWHVVPAEPLPPQLETILVFEPDWVEVVLGDWVEGNWQRSRHLFKWNGAPMTYPLPGGLEMALEQEGGTWTGRLRKGDLQTAAVEAKAVNSNIYLVTSNPAAADVGAVKRAVDALASFYGWPLELTVISPSQAPMDPPALAFWFAGVEGPTSQAWLEQGSVVVFDAGDQPYIPQAGPIQLGTQVFHDGPHLLRRVEPGLKGVPVWTDEKGTPLLELEKVGKGTLLRLATRLLPEWSTLPQHEVLPLWLAEVLESQWLGLEAELDVPAALAIDSVQSRPYSHTTEFHARDVVKSSLGLPLWLAALAFFCLERWWSERRRAR